MDSHDSFIFNQYIIIITLLTWALIINDVMHTLLLGFRTSKGKKRKKKSLQDFIILLSVCQGEKLRNAWRYQTEIYIKYCSFRAEK